MANVVRPSWISKLEPFNGMWHLSENGKPRGQFDAIVIAHNGNFLPPYFLVSPVLVFPCNYYSISIQICLVIIL